MRTPIRAWREYTRCKYWKANILFAGAAFIFTAITMRLLIGTLAAIIPLDSIAGEEGFAASMLLTAIEMNLWHFGFACLIAAAGGFVSFLHEAKADPAANLKILNAAGHMSAAQFAGLLMYLLSVEFAWSPPWAYTLCGLAGWSGNKGIQMLNDKVLSRIGVDLESKK